MYKLVYLKILYIYLLDKCIVLGGVKYEEKDKIYIFGTNFFALLNFYVCM